MIADGIGQCVDLSGRFGGAAAGVNADVAKIVPEARFQKSPRFGSERLSFGLKYLSDGRRGSERRGHPFGLVRNGTAGNVCGLLGVHRQYLFRDTVGLLLVRILGGADRPGTRGLTTQLLPAGLESLAAATCALPSQTATGTLALGQRGLTGAEWRRDVPAFALRRDRLRRGRNPHALVCRPVDPRCVQHCTLPRRITSPRSLSSRSRYSR